MSSFFLSHLFSLNALNGTFLICSPFAWALFPFYSLGIYTKGLDIDGVECMCVIRSREGMCTEQCVKAACDQDPAATSQAAAYLYKSFPCLKHLFLCNLPGTYRFIFQLLVQKLLLGKLSPIAVPRLTSLL